jgi:hypothetical protein
MSAMAATFELDRFIWDDGAFEVAGRWSAESKRSLGRARLVIEIDGRRRRIGAQGGKQATAWPDGGEWTARFQCVRRPERVGPAELEVGGDLLIDLPKPEVPEKQPEPAPPPPDVRGAEALLEQLRSERAESEAAARRLKEEREAADAASKRLAEERQGAESAAKAAREAAERAENAKPPEPPPAPKPAPEPAPARRAEPIPRPAFSTETPRREAIRESLSRPREPKSVLPADEPARQREIAYALAGVIVILIVLLLVLLL